MTANICIGIMDEKKGPIPIYYKNINSKLAGKIVKKILFSVLSFTQEITEENLTGETIIPFIAEKKITFAYLFPIKDSKARGGLRQIAIVLVFDSKNREAIYENAPYLTEIVKEFANEIELKDIHDKKLSNKLLSKLEGLPRNISLDASPISKDQSGLVVTCPFCSVTKEIEIPVKVKGIKFIEHNIPKNEICEHSFTVYLDSKLNILGYQDVKVELKETKKFIEKLKSPYD